MGHQHELSSIKDYGLMVYGLKGSGLALMQLSTLWSVVRAINK
ncbi:hypothetical protein [Rubritalea tangerina]